MDQGTETENTERAKALERAALAAAIQAVNRDGCRAWRGYLVNRNPLTGDIFVTRNGHTICRPSTIEAAFAAIADLT